MLAQLSVILTKPAAHVNGMDVGCGSFSVIIHASQLLTVWLCVSIVIYPKFFF